MSDAPLELVFTPSGFVPVTVPDDRVHDAADVYRQLAPAVLGFFRTHGAADPEDLLGEVFYQVARDILQFRGDGAALRRWVFTIAYRRLVDSWRRRSARPVVVSEIGPVPVPVQPDASEALPDPELAAAVAALTPEQREVIVLRFVADLPLADVARITGRNVGAVKALQHRGLATLERMLGSR